MDTNGNQLDPAGWRRCCVWRATRSFRSRPPRTRSSSPCPGRHGHRHRLAGEGPGATLELAERLAARGYQVVPHIAARLVVDEVHLAEIVDRLQAAGIDDIFVPAGDADPPAGEYDAALPVLAELRTGPALPRWGSPGTPRATPPSTTTSPCRPCGTSGARHLHREQPLLRPEGVAGLDRAGAPPPCLLSIQLGIAGPVETTRLLSVASEDIGVGQ